MEHCVGVPQIWQNGAAANMRRHALCYYKFLADIVQIVIMQACVGITTIVLPRSAKLRFASTVATLFLTTIDCSRDIVTILTTKTWQQRRVVATPHDHQAWHWIITSMSDICLRYGKHAIDYRVKVLCSR